MTRARTMNDEAVLEVLSGAATPLSAYQVLAALKDHGIQSPPVVYRALDRLEKAGQIHRVEQLNAYVACPGHHDGHSIILAVCSCCKRVEEWGAGAVDGLFAQLARASGFKLVQRSIEVTGLCAACQGAAVAEATPTACCGAHGAEHHRQDELTAPSRKDATRRRATPAQARDAKVADATVTNAKAPTPRELAVIKLAYRPASSRT